MERRSLATNSCKEHKTQSFSTPPSYTVLRNRMTSHPSRIAKIKSGKSTGGKYERILQQLITATAVLTEDYHVNKTLCHITLFFLKQSAGIVKEFSHCLTLSSSAASRGAETLYKLTEVWEEGAGMCHVYYHFRTWYLFRACAMLTILEEKYPCWFSCCWRNSEQPKTFYSLLRTLW